MTDKRLDRAIFKTPYGFRIFLRIHGEPHTKRFPPTYSLDALRRWRDDHERIYRRSHARGTLSADITRYLMAVRSMTSYADRKREIAAWEPALGNVARWRITAEDVRAQLHAWKGEGYAASTCNHRRTALSHLYTVLDGKDAPNPTRNVPPFIEPPATARGIEIRTALTTIRRVGGFTRTRLLLLLWTGMRPSELKRVQPEHVDFEEGTCLVLTAKGGPARIVSLNRSALKAFRRFFRLEMTGPFSTASMRKSLVRACTAAPALPLFRVYDLRHTYGTQLRRAGADLSDIAHQLGHSSLRMTKRYAPTALEKIKQAGARMRKSPEKVTSLKRRTQSA